MPRSAILVLLALVLFPISRASAQVSPDELVKNAAAARARFEAFAPAHWTAVHEGGGGVQFVVHVIQSAGKRRLGISLQQQGGELQGLVRIVQRDGFWYVQEGNATGKFRPYEAPVLLSTAYYYLLRSMPVFLTPESVAGLGVFQAARDGHSLFRTPVSESERSRFAEFLMAAEERRKAAPPDQQAAAAREIEMVQDLVAHGIPVQVAEALGLVEGYGTPGKRTRIQDFRWLESVEDREFGVDDVKWEDYTDDPTATNVENLVMLSHCGWWRPGVADFESDVRLLDLVSGRLRRVPFRGPIALPGCFLPGRTSVVVTGLDLAGTAVGVYVVDLKTGENRRLGGATLAEGWCFDPVLSPDGKSLAVVHRGPKDGPGVARLYTVDVASGEAKPVGSPMDVSNVSWDPDGDGWILLYRRAGADEEEQGVICHVNRDAQMIPLRKGHNPVVVDARRLIYWEERAGGWMECDLRGKNPVRIADGLPGHGFPALAPGGDRVIMMRFEKDQPPLPVLLELGMSKGTVITSVQGLWGHPRWR